MRLIGHLDSETGATTFGDYLYAQDIENSVEEEGGQWSIWVHAEDQLETAEQQLKEFQQTPEDQKYSRASRVAREKRDRVEQENEAARKRYFDRSNILPSGLYQFGPVTVTLIGLSLFITFITQFGGNSLFPWFAIVPFEPAGPNLIRFEDGFSPLLTWQIWRWFTPMFVHFSIIHLVLNLWWLKDLGGALESYLGRWSFLALVLVISAPANMVQFLFQGPSFGGMSGVVFGLLAYVWIRGRLDPFCGLHLSQTTTMFMMIWFFLCLFGFVGSVANYVHAAGLGVGLIAGALAARRT